LAAQTRMRIGARLPTDERVCGYGLLGSHGHQ
jgi:hypothetical protein